MTKQDKLRTPEEVLNKPLDELVEEDALTLALAFELERVTPKQFWAMDKTSLHDYAQRILDFFQISAKKLVVGLLNPETERATENLQGRMSELKIKSPRPWSRVPKNRADEFRILELAFELWLDRSPKIDDASAVAEAAVKLDEPIPKELSKRLFRRGEITDRDIYTITGNSTGRFSDEDIDQIKRFCPLRAIKGQEFAELPLSAQRLYLTRLANFFKTTWGDLAKYWFKGTVSTTNLEKVAKDLNVQKSPIICNRDVVKAIKRCAEREVLAVKPAEAQASTSTNNETFSVVANNPSTPPPDRKSFWLQQRAGGSLERGSGRRGRF